MASRKLGPHRAGLLGCSSGYFQVPFRERFDHRAGSGAWAAGNLFNSCRAASCADPQDASGFQIQIRRFRRHVAARGIPIERHSKQNSIDRDSSWHCVIHQRPQWNLNAIPPVKYGRGDSQVIDGDQIGRAVSMGLPAYRYEKLPVPRNVFFSRECLEWSRRLTNPFNAYEEVVLAPARQKLRYRIENSMAAVAAGI